MPELNLPTLPVKRELYPGFETTLRYNPLAQNPYINPISSGLKIHPILTVTGSFALEEVTDNSATFSIKQLGPTDISSLVNHWSSEYETNLVREPNGHTTITKNKKQPPFSDHKSEA